MIVELAVAVVVLGTRVVLAVAVAVMFVRLLPAVLLEAMVVVVVVVVAVMIVCMLVALEAKVVEVHIVVLAVTIVWMLLAIVVMVRVIVVVFAMVTAAVIVWMLLAVLVQAIVVPVSVFVSVMPMSPRAVCWRPTAQQQGSSRPAAWCRQRNPTQSISSCLKQPRDAHVAKVTIHSSVSASTTRPELSAIQPSSRHNPRPCRPPPPLPPSLDPIGHNARTHPAASRSASSSAARCASASAFAASCASMSGFLKLPRLQLRAIGRWHTEPHDQQRHTPCLSGADARMQVAHRPGRREALRSEESTTVPSQIGRV